MTAAGRVQNDVRIGDLEVRLARSAAEVDAAQALRYRVFYDEMAARPSPEVAASLRDTDSFDAIADHLLVIDRSRTQDFGVVGTYRLIRREIARQYGSFYTSDEYDIRSLLSLPGEILEVGRSCVDVGYRNRPTMQLLWRAIAEYVHHYDIVVLFGCASLHGTDPSSLGQQLSYLYHYHLAPPALRPVAVPERYVDMNILDTEQIRPRAAVAELPPLIKGYLRLGGFVGDGAVIDHEFNTTDVCVVVKTDLISDRYLKHYERSMQDSSLFPDLADE